MKVSDGVYVGDIMLLALTLSAWADSITLDSGATIEGDLARYEFGGDCQISVTEGDLSGVILIVPCHRVESFVRTAVRVPVPIGVVGAPPAAAPAAPARALPEVALRAEPLVVPLVAVVDSPAGGQPVAEGPLDAAAQEEEPEVAPAPEVASAPEVEDEPTVAAGEEPALAPRPAPAMGAIGAPAAEPVPSARKPVSF